MVRILLRDVRKGRTELRQAAVGALGSIVSADSLFDPGVQLFGGRCVNELL